LPPTLLGGKLPGMTDEALIAMLDGMEKRLCARLDQLGNRFDHLESRFDRLEGRFDRLENRFDRLEARFERLEKSVYLLADKLITKT